MILLAPVSLREYHFCLCFLEVLEVEVIFGWKFLPETVQHALTSIGHHFHRGQPTEGMFQSVQSVQSVQFSFRRNLRTTFAGYPIALREYHFYLCFLEVLEVEVIFGVVLSPLNHPFRMALFRFGS